MMMKIQVGMANVNLNKKGSIYWTFPREDKYELLTQNIKVKRKKKDYKRAIEGSSLEFWNESHTIKKITKGTSGEFNLRYAEFTVAGGMGNVEQAAEAWRAGIVDNEDVALGASFCGHARPEQTFAQLLSFPAYVKVNRANSQSNFQVGLTLCGLFPCQIIQWKGRVEDGQRDRGQQKEYIPERMV